eukprot:c27223_g1_i1.p1 GENE.c27223_g1_i1~~c27223_g1_i1.p1  ORF type:complete len:501 (-),score=95.97 c27223_g1_i1:69-1571(-)
MNTALASTLADPFAMNDMNLDWDFLGDQYLVAQPPASQCHESSHFHEVGQETHATANPCGVFHVGQLHQSQMIPQATFDLAFTPAVESPATTSVSPTSTNSPTSTTTRVSKGKRARVCDVPDEALDPTQLAKRQRRREQNKLASQNSRHRKFQRITELEQELEVMANENKDLKAEVNNTARENELLKESLLAHGITLPMLALKRSGIAVFSLALLTVVLAAAQRSAKPADHSHTFNEHTPHQCDQTTYSGDWWHLVEKTLWGETPNPFAGTQSRQQKDRYPMTASGQISSPSAWSAPAMHADAGSTLITGKPSESSPTPLAAATKRPMSTADVERVVESVRGFLQTTEWEHRDDELDGVSAVGSLLSNLTQTARGEGFQPIHQMQCVEGGQPGLRPHTSPQHVCSLGSFDSFAAPSLACLSEISPPPMHHGTADDFEALVNLSQTQGVLQQNEEAGAMSYLADTTLQHHQGVFLAENFLSCDTGIIDAFGVAHCQGYPSS